ncbi:hypothetical protein RKD19_001179 [Streptomyces canus]
MVHRNAPLTETGRLRLAHCVVEEGWPLRRAAERFQVSPTTARRWAERYRQFGESGMSDRSSRPDTSPRRTPTRTERRIIKVRVLRRWGPARIAHLLHLVPSTVHRVLTPLRPGPPRPSGPGHRPRHTTLRTQPPRRTRPRRHQETRQHPRRRRPQDPRPARGPQEPLERRVQLPAHRRRRPLPPGLQRDPRGREEGDRHRLLDPRPHLFHPGRDHRRAGPDRQRLLLPLTRLARHAGGGRSHPQANPALPTADKRQGRTLQPHPAR